ncbi:GDP-L-fucose synthase [Cryobacterium sp. M15]|uniref:GDP-L-fucose synthase family protein n=1 Tax=Cryobacterium sp. M15 TaxID=2048291 RepID=UPI0018EA6722|nr:GDP-L-fucose synthase [Cryobacterium sp. M15]
MNIDKDRRVLITGASGVIGVAVQDLLSAQGYDVVAVSSVDADLTDESATFRLVQYVKPKFVIHLAARVHGLMGNLHQQGAMFYDNARINSNVVEASRVAGVSKIVAMGSVAMYSDSVELPMNEADVWNGAPHASEAGYAHAKRAMLAQLEAYKDQYGLDYAFALSTNLFGPRDRFDELQGHVLPSLLSKFHRGVESGDPVTVWGSGTPTRDFLYSKDAAIALQLLLEKGTGVYNLASGRHHSIRDTAALISDISGYTGEVQWDRNKPDGQSARAYDVTRITDLGWESTTTFEDALRETYAWYSNNTVLARR